MHTRPSTTQTEPEAASHRFRTLPPIIHLHAAVFTSWLVVLVIQTTLVLRGRTAVHRRLGVAGVVLAALMLVVHPAYIWGGLLALTSIPPVVTQVSATETWHRLASLLLR